MPCDQYLFCCEVAEDVSFTSSPRLLIAFHSRRGNTLTRNSGFNSISTRSSSASRGCRGNAAGSCLQALRAQVRKLRVRSFIFLFLFAGVVFVFVLEFVFSYTMICVSSIFQRGWWCGCDGVVW